MSDQNPPEDQSILEQQHQQRVEQQAADTSGAEQPASAGQNYDDMSGDELAAEAERRGLAKSGSKAEVRARLEANDRGES